MYYDGQLDYPHYTKVLPHELELIAQLYRNLNFFRRYLRSCWEFGKHILLRLIRNLAKGWHIYFHLGNTGSAKW